MSKKEKTFFAKAKQWTNKHQLQGTHAFLRFVMLVFIERLSQQSDEFVFKGGNLLWVYIKTPRPTMDVDFSTLSLVDHEAVRHMLAAVCSNPDPSIRFAVKTFVQVDSPNGKAARVTIAFRTQEGQQNTFDLDIVYAVPTDIVTLPSPLESGIQLRVASIENIVADKLSAGHRFGGGNSRMKDFDDLLRISRVMPSPLNWTKLDAILRERGIPPHLDPAWVNAQTERTWASHIRRHEGLPSQLIEAIEIVNRWLMDGLSA